MIKKMPAPVLPGRASQFKENIMINIENIPQTLAGTPQWVAWQKTPRGNGKKGKKPINPKTGSSASVNKPESWGTFDEALGFFNTRKDMAGIGFVFTENDDYVGIDLDDCLDRGELLPWAADIVEAVDSYTEISPSGKGLHLFTKGSLPANRRKEGIEMYRSDRFFTVTGNHLAGTAEDINSNELAEVFEKSFEQPLTKQDRTSALFPEDRKLIAKAAKAKNRDNFVRLWEGDCSAYPSQSEADLAFCKMLAYWTGKDRQQMIRILAHSGLSRPKWYGSGGALSKYAEATIAKALESDEPPLQTKDKTEAESFNLTDLGNAERMASKFGDVIRYCYQKKCWYIWDGKRWAEDRSNNLTMQKAKLVVRDIYNEAAKAENYEKRQALSKHAGKSESVSRMAAMVSLARNEAGVSVLPDELDQNPWLLNCLNGTVDLKTGKLLPHRRNDLITKLVHFNYDPNAACPRWEKFLDRIMAGNQELISFLQRAIGYAITGDNGEQSMFILYGSGANGKSTFLETINAMISDYAMQTPTETLLVKRNGAMSNDVARLKGARFVTASEAEFGQRLAEGLIKQMTGQDTISARFLHQEFFDFKPTHKIFLGTNHKPIIRGNEHAIWRRIKLVPFEVTIPPEERDRNLPISLQAELPGILAWAIDGCLDWQSSGLGDPEAVVKATRSYRTEMDVFNDFLTDCCDKGELLRVSSKDLYGAYCNWCDENGEKPLGQIALGRRLKDQDFHRGRDSRTGARIWLGLGLASPGQGH